MKTRFIIFFFFLFEAFLFAGQSDGFEKCFYLSYMVVLSEKEEKKIGPA